MLDRKASILVLGASGLVGHAILASLERSGFETVLKPARRELDLLDGAAVRSYFADHRPQVLIHLASLVFGLGGNLARPFESLHKNTLVNDNVFAAAYENPVKQIAFAGTVAAYPYPFKSLPLTEDAFFDGPPHHAEFGYAMAKRHAHVYLTLLSEQLGTNFTYAILTNLYGRYDRFNAENGHVIPSLISKAYEAAQKGQPLEVWGDGHAERDFLHAQDAADAILLCLDAQPANRTINISSGRGVPIGTVARLIAKNSGVDEVRFHPDRPTGIPKRVVGNAQLRALGFSPAIDIEAGLAMTCRWYADNIRDVRR